MKAKFLLATAILFVAVSVSFGQQSILHDAYLTEGKIVFDVAYPDAQPSGAAASEVPAAQTVYFRYDMMRIETKMADSHTDVLIVNCKDKTANALKTVAGKKYAVLSNNDDVQKEAAAIPYLQLKNIDDYKEIAGYNCQKNDFVITDKNQNTLNCDIYISNKIVVANPNWYSAQFKEVANFMFEYSMKQSGITVKFSAKSVEPFKENENIFNVPSGYKLISKSDFAKLQPLSTN